MKERLTQALLAAVVVLLTLHLFRGGLELSGARAEESAQAPTVVRAELIELVNKQGIVVAQLFTGDDGGGNIRLRNGEGIIRVKLGATADGAGLLMVDEDVEPAVQLATKKSQTSLTLTEKGKEKRVFEP
jgi:hypothetical protein